MSSHTHEYFTGIRTTILPGPCHGCRFAPVCADRRLACSDFSQFVAYGAVRQAKPRLPTGQQYRRIFS